MPTYEELRAAAEPAWRANQHPPRPLFVVSINTSSIAAAPTRRSPRCARCQGTRRASMSASPATPASAGPSRSSRCASRTAPTVLYGNVTRRQGRSRSRRGCRDTASRKDFAFGIDRRRGGRRRARARRHLVLDEAAGALADAQLRRDRSREHRALHRPRRLRRTHECARTMSPDELIERRHRLDAARSLRLVLLDRHEWEFLRTQTREPKYLVCNADEGDPGAWVNRILMEGDPHLLIEGMLIAALRHRRAYGFIYIRDEYPLAIERMNRAIEQCRERGLLRRRRARHRREFDAEVIRGAGAYVCGEETGLIARSNDGRGMPRIKPPFPAQTRRVRQPTNVNNVETYAGRRAAAHRRASSQHRRHRAEPRHQDLLLLGRVRGGLHRGAVRHDVGPAARGSGRHRRRARVEGDAAGRAAVRATAAERRAGPCRSSPSRSGRSAPVGGGGFVFIDDTACVVDINVHVLVVPRGRVVRPLHDLPRRQPAHDRDLPAHRARRGRRNDSSAWSRWRIAAVLELRARHALADDHAQHAEVLPRGVRCARHRASLPAKVCAG